MTTTTRGAVACGHPATAAAAGEILAEGGNAFDAVLAALCASTVAEPILSSLGGGGFLLAQSAGGDAALYDFFVETPLRRRPATEIDFYPIDADFGTAIQEFHIGMGAIATPGLIAGLFAVHRDLGTLPMTRLVEPAARMARQGVALRPIDTYLFQVVGPILVARPEARALFTRGDGAPLAHGDVLRQPELAATLEALAREGAALFYQGEIGQHLIADCRAQGGQLGAEDLTTYKVVERQPLERTYRDARILTNPPPSSGGILIAFALELLARNEAPGADGSSAAQAATLLRVMALTNRARVETRLHEAVAEAEEAAAAARLLDPTLLERYAREVRGHAPCTRGTTHMSVVDAAGNVAALSVSNGEGCGYMVPGTGIMMNNMLGEEDINTHGFHAWPEGSRMSSMMSPTVIRRADGRLAALGSGGSNRIRTAILQVLINLIDGEQEIAAAVAAPRLHLEAGVAHVEGGFADEVAAAAGALAERSTVWPARNLFFGGVHGVERASDGRFSAAGDPRRGGSTSIV